MIERLVDRKLKEWDRQRSQYREPDPRQCAKNAVYDNIFFNIVIGVIIAVPLVAAMVEIWKS